MSERAQQTQALVRARERFLETGTLVDDDGVVRAEIAASWRRCALSGLRPELASATYEAGGASEGQVWTAAESVLEKRREQLADTSAGLILADHRGRVLQVTTTDGRLAELFDEHDVARGYNFQESVVGTNGIGTVLETREAMRIVGHEHFIGGFNDLTCVGVPIRHPITRQLRGVLNVTCPTAEYNALLLPFALEAGHEIERRLYLAGSRKERLLLEQFLSVQSRTGAHAVVTLNEEIIISSPAAGRILDGVSQTVLWEQVAHVIAGGASDAHLLELPTGERIATRCHPVRDGGAVIGAFVELDSEPAPRPSRARALRAGRAGADGRLPGLAGSSVAWRTVVDQAIAYRESGLSFFLVGPPGSGKFALLDALFEAERAAGRVHVFEAALQPIEGAARWVTAVRDAIVAGDDAVVLVRHVEALEETATRALCGLLEALAPRRPRLVGTHTPHDGPSGPAPALIDRASAGAIQLPPLRDRTEDFAELLAALTRRHSVGGIQPQWTPDAVQMLTRLEWPANVSQLENLVRRILSGRRSADIRAKDLPEDIRSQAPRRVLSYLQRVELEAMTTALQQARGNKSRAAELVGVSRATFYRKLRAFGLDLDRTAY
ncbi:sigma-54-dependent Fis family transcriptional regulator [Conexibacter sp. CPCC 206217]|uniref:sigma-54-dependent Fis family transcriptional regulator n=1 Tax=Conexibacter sp. CPCC 206217 TaxID=3064574 RepID=UPI00271B65D1|nr:helix-turn-helix domain-containing protein [Conexibacter sp. CPCC 206217]MDO8208925.1 helix-turn-helix domain-containing protein [Conexibacter sp. CPCC 206217]